MNQETINSIIEEFHMPQHIRKHCEQVTRVADFLAKKIQEQGFVIHRKNIHAAAMLHDLVRICDIKEWHPEKFTQELTQDDHEVWNVIRDKYRNIHHADAGAEIIRKKGYPDIADCIKTHDFLAIISENPPKSIEQKIVFYADKRVRHDEIVSLHERFEDGERRHRKQGDPTGEGARAKEKIFELETELMNQAKILATDINSNI